MAKRRTIVIFLSFLIIFSFLFISSSFFKLKTVEICFFDYNNNQIDFRSNLFYTSQDKVDVLKEVAKQDYGTTLFLLDTNKYFNKFEYKNPYAKLLNVKQKYPNKIVFNVLERRPFYYISSNNVYFILDEDFKVLQLSQQKPKNLVQLCAITMFGQAVDFFDFFGVSSNAFVEGQFLTENNLVLSNLANLKELLEEAYLNTTNISQILIIESSDNDVCLKIQTCDIYGVAFQIINIFNNFQNKLNLVLKEFKNSISQNEKIKICYGCYYIDDNLTVSWNNL